MKKFGVLLLVLGSFVLVIGVLARVYVYDELAVIPAGVKTDAVAATTQGAPATYFDLPTLGEKTMPLTNRTRIRGDLAASKKASAETGKDVVVWDAYACTGASSEDCLENPLPLAGARDRLAFDAHTAAVVPWSGALHESGGVKDDNPETTGNVYKLPFNVQKRDYKYWNSDVGAPVDLSYEGESKVKGLDVYKFNVRVSPTKVGTIDLPGDLVGSSQANVTGDRVVSPSIDMTFEPETGVMITTSSSPNSWVEVDGKRVLTITEGTLTIDDATIADSVATYKPLAFGLHVLRVWALPLGIAVGLLTMLGGLALVRRSNRTRLSETDDPAVGRRGARVAV